MELESGCLCNIGSPDNQCPVHGEIYKSRYSGFTTPEPKVEEQDGEQELELTQVRAEIYGNPTYLAGLLERVKRAYFDKEWKSVERLFEAEIEEMHKRAPLPESVAPPSLPKLDETQAWQAVMLGEEFIEESAEELAEPVVPISKLLCPQCGNERDDPREDSIERMLVCGDSFHTGRAAAPVALPTHQIVECNDWGEGHQVELRCSCGRTFIGLGDEALARSRASFEAHLPEKEGK